MKINSDFFVGVALVTLVGVIAFVSVQGGRDNGRFAADMHAKGFIEIQYQGRQIWVKADQVQQFIAPGPEKP